MKQKEVQQLLDKWQARLRLADWRLRLEYKNQGKKEQFIGQAIMWPDTKCAVIKIARRPKKGDTQDPIEQVVIHELLHLHMRTFHSMELRTTRCMNLEAAIDAIAFGLWATENPGARDPHTGRKV